MVWIPDSFKASTLFGPSPGMIETGERKSRDALADRLVMFEPVKYDFTEINI